MKPVSMKFGGTSSPWRAMAAARTHWAPIPMGTCWTAPAMRATVDGVDLGLARVVADDHELAGQVELVDRFTTPIAEPSLPPKKPLMSGLA